MRDRRIEELSDEQRDLVGQWYNLDMLGNVSERRFNIYSAADPLVRQGRNPVSLVFCGPWDLNRTC